MTTQTPLDDIDRLLIDALVQHATAGARGGLVTLGFPLLTALVSIALMVLGSGIVRASRHAGAEPEAIESRFDEPIRAGPNLGDG